MQLADADFNRDGFAVLPQFLSRADCRELQRLTPQIVAAAERWHANGEPLWFLQDDIPALAALLKQPHLIKQLQTAAGLQGRHLELLAITLYSRRPGDPGTAWHQDARFIPTDRLPALSLWLPLQSIDARNSPLQFLSGSHHHCLLQQPQPAHSPPVGLPMNQPFVASPMDFGDATIHAPWSLHGARSNRSGSIRHALIVNWLYAPLSLHDEPELHGHLHPPVINTLRHQNHRTLQRRLSHLKAQ
mgnify:CR=1 FL=1